MDDSAEDVVSHHNHFHNLAHFDVEKGDKVVDIRIVDAGVLDDRAHKNDFRCI